MASPQPAQLANGLSRLFEGLKSDMGMVLENMPRLGEEHGPSDPVKEPRSQHFLKGLNLLRNSRLGQEELFCRSREASILRDGQKGLQLGKVHTCPSLDVWHGSLIRTPLPSGRVFPVRIPFCYYIHINNEFDK